MRLDKYLATHSDATRTLAKMAIKTGRVEINGTVIKDQGKKVKPDDVVSINGRELKESGEVYLVMNKKAGIICATQDEEQDTVLDFLDGYTHKELHIAGRLDKDTTGLVLITSDGKWSHRVTSPNYVCEKSYLLETILPIEESYVEEFSKGILLRDEVKPTRPAKLEIITPTSARLTLTEGKYHQVKRMFGAMGNRVTKLQRESVGGVKLDGLEEGEFRELTESEVASF
ncbi:MAG: 16S rRNA pseudouridine516 synthase [Rubritalea sp.]|jgi:16S rRNA pseudouridine516 synthase